MADRYDLLDRPVWHWLTGPGAALARDGGGAVRIDPGYGPFAAARDRSDAAQAALAALVQPGEQVWLVEPEEWSAPPGMRHVRTAPLLQMVAQNPVPIQLDDAPSEPLGSDDAAAMTELALATEPGPWSERTRLYGQFYGIRRDERLAAMAGPRMRPAEGLQEVSGVCTWPEYRGQGLAGVLIRRVMADIVAVGRTPFLHSYAGNTKAIGLYESLGFVARRNMVVTVLERG
ncbi:MULTISPECIES: GNAT family N-acetyltransferase [unclassified Novosphingobium]|uniref:GNAT family N-acetyltransferase n=1 Tax=unclassified Novosphingobium TaxID=2644732 RepID=UPI0025E88701|nr:MULTISPECIES: GNAT family N-acetyltransferase [unclassified Novosphingobium]HQV03023.1 GNAT family N-acetyltransferase [Novosphingobium sp.]